MKIWHFVPYDLNKNFGKSCNEYCRMVQSNEDWICISDADIMILTPNYGHLMYEIVNMYPNIGLFTCYTNRVKNKHQIIREMFDEPNMGNHRIKALELYYSKKHSLKDHSFRVISGYFMLFKKQTWIDTGGFSEEGILGVDNRFSKAVVRLGKQIKVIEGLYAMHYYRFNEGIENKKHLK